MKKLLVCIGLFGVVMYVKSGEYYSSAGAGAVASSSIDTSQATVPFTTKVTYVEPHFFSDRNRDLVIINDVTENAAKNPGYIGFPFVDARGVNIPMIFKLLYAFQEKQLVLTTKSLFYQVQLMAEKWDDLQVKFQSTQIPYYKYLSYLPREPFFIHQQRIENGIKYSGYIQTFDNFYNNFIKNIFNNRDFDKAMHDLFINLNAEEVYNIGTLFLYKVLYQKFLKLGYQCREVGQHYLLFIPPDLQNELSRIREDSLRDIYLGLRYTDLPYFYYNRSFGLDKRNTMKAALSYEEAGVELLHVLDKLCFPYSESKHSRPDFNIMLTGHGMPDYVAAVDKDTFNKILILFQNRLQLKCLVVDSCFIGGKQFKNVFNVDNLYNSKILSNLTYPILFNGSFYAVTNFFVGLLLVNAFSRNFVNKELKSYDFFRTLFYYLNQDPPLYYQALEKWQNVFMDQGIRQNFITNYASIKFPNVSWIQPMDYDKRVKKLSQVEVTASSRGIVISKDKKIILLSANIIFPKLIFEGVAKNFDEIRDNLPIILPVNYNMQKYMMKELILPHFVLTATENKLEMVVAVLRHLFLSLVEKVNEPIDIIIEKITIGDIVVEDVFIDVKNGLIHFLYVEDNVYYKISIQENSSIKADQINKDDVQKSINEIRKDLKINFLKEYNLRQVKSKLDNFLSQQSMPEIVQQSRQKYEAMTPDEHKEMGHKVAEQRSPSRIHNPYKWKQPIKVVANG